MAEKTEQPHQPAARVRAVSVGGGTGQPTVLRALRRLGWDISAVVAMADDGGSTGRLRRETGTIPPGDLRKCLVALAGDTEQPLARALSRRLPYAENHALGNLVITALAEETGSFPEAVDTVGRALGCVGRVYPSTLDDVVLRGVTRDGRDLDGQALISHGPCTLSRVWLDPAAPTAYPGAVDAIMAADVVVVGPGSLFTSIIPNILVPGIARALRETLALRVFVCPKADTQGETWGLAADEYVEALLLHGMSGALDAVVVHRAKESSGLMTRTFHALTPAELARPEHVAGPREHGFHAVSATDEAISRIEALGPHVFLGDYTDPAVPAGHNVALLAETLREVVACRSRLR